MTVAEAKEILRRVRPDTVDSAESEVGAALELAGQDGELAKWWLEEQAWQLSTQTALRSLEPSALLRSQLTAVRSRRRVGWWQWPASGLALAAAITLLFGGVWWLLRPQVSGSTYAVWQQRMARAALREYRMDIVTNNLAAVQAYLAKANRQQVISIPSKVRALPVVGGAAVRFQNQPVSMVCFDRGGGQLLWMFVISRTALSNAPREQRFDAIGDLATASWTTDDQVVLMAVLGDQQLLRGFL